MNERELRELQRMGRRRFVRTLSAMGFSGTTLNFITQYSLANESDLNDEVPYVAYLAKNNPEAVESERDSTGRAPIYRTIPKELWIETEAAWNGVSQILGIIRSKVQNSEGVGVGVSTESSGTKAVAVEYLTKETYDGDIVRPAISFERLREILPNTVDGHVGDGEHRKEVENIDVVPVKRTIKESAFEYDYVYDPNPGGCKGQAVDGSGANGLTLGTPAYDNSLGETVIVTCGHCVKQSSGVTINQPAEPDKIGQSDKVEKSQYFDAATVELDDPLDYINDIAANSPDTYMDWDIDGMVTWSTIKNNEGNSNYGHNYQGIGTGRGFGSITMTWVSTSSHQKSYDLDDPSGDNSGGPMFRVVSDEWSYIGGIVWAANSSITRGTSMEAIESRFSVDVAPGD